MKWPHLFILQCLNKKDVLINKGPKLPGGSNSPKSKHSTHTPDDLILMIQFGIGLDRNVHL